MKNFLVTMAFAVAVFAVGYVAPTQAQQLTYSPSTAYDLNNASSTSFAASTTVDTIDDPRGAVFNQAGTLFFAVDQTDDTFASYPLSTPWDITTLQTPSASTTLNGTPTNVAIADDGRYAYVTDNSGDQIDMYVLGTPYDVTTLTASTSVSTLTESAPMAVTTSYDGSKIFFSGNARDGRVYTYELSTPYLLSTADSGTTTDLLTGDIRSIAFSPNGYMFYATDAGTNGVHQFSLSTAYDLKTAVDEGEILSINSNRGMTWGDSGASFYATESSGPVRQYEVTAASDYVFTETLANDGALDGEMIIYASGEQFVDAGGDTFDSAQVTIGGLPSGLTPAMTLEDDDTKLVLTFSGSANDNDNADDVADLTFTFDDDAFVGGDASEVTNATGAFSSGFSIDFEDTPRIEYSGGFVETSPDDGFASGSIVATLVFDTYVSPFSSTTLTLGGIPAGLTPSYVLSAGDTVLTVTLTGTTTDHTDADDVSDITFAFTDAAFTTLASTSIMGASGPYSTGLGIDFADESLERVSNSSGGWRGKFVCGDSQANNYQSTDGPNRHRQSNCVFGTSTIPAVAAEDETGASHLSDTHTLLQSLLAKLKRLHAQLVLRLKEESEGVAVLGASVSCSFTQGLAYGDTHDDVQSLQQFLNAQGYLVAAAGDGSPGHESTYFGWRTQQALIAFQEAYATEVLTPTGHTKGNGLFGPATRAKATALCSQ